MAHGFNSVVLKRGAMAVGCGKGGAKGSIGSRRIFAPHFKLQVLDSYRNDADCKGNQRATARKYGIHRRQIQKWLQVEGNLRSSVGSRGNNVKGEQGAGGFPVALGHHQERTCEGAAEARVPALSPQEAAPLDCSTRRSVDLASPHVASPEAPPLSPADQWRAAVADSIGSAGTHAPASDPAAPIDLSLKRPAVAAGSAPAIRPCLSPRAPSPPSLAQRPHPDVWDLSTKRKCESPPPSSRPPFKLFKPYLDDVSSSGASTSSSCDDGPSGRPCMPPCCAAAPQPSFPSYHHHHHLPEHNNNNNTYALHELQPPSSITYFYTFPTPHHPSDYDMLCAAAPYEEYPQAPFKQRHSYSLDFKLSAIECYYQDSVCRGNQRAVATKYNIHRRQVQKWLKQADELRQKNETMKQTTVVR